MAGYHPNRTQKDPTRPGVPPLAWKFLDLLWHLTWIVRKNLGNYFAIGEMIGFAKKKNSKRGCFPLSIFWLGCRKPIHGRPTVVYFSANDTTVTILISCHFFGRRHLDSLAMCCTCNMTRLFLCVIVFGSDQELRYCSSFQCHQTRESELDSVDATCPSLGACQGHNVLADDMKVFKADDCPTTQTTHVI